MVPYTEKRKHTEQAVTPTSEHTELLHVYIYSLHTTKARQQLLLIQHLGISNPLDTVLYYRLLACHNYMS